MTFCYTNLMNIPEIRIQYAKYLDPYFRSLFKYNQEAGLIKSEAEYPDAEWITRRVEEYNQEWLSRTSVLEYLQKILELDFHQATIDVYVVGQMKGAISTPITSSSQLPATKYIDVLTHEIIHRLIGDNQQQINLETILQTLFPSETDLCKVHIIVHALMKKVYLEFLKEPERLIANKDRDQKAPDYMKAWEIVDTIGEDNIISKFKSYYTK